MVYSIQIKSNTDLDKVVSSINKVLDRDGRFTCALTPASDRLVTICRVRLTEAKQYCGQHPGPCLIDRPKKNARYLESEDWIAFNGLVNDALDKVGVSADVWSTPMETLDKGRKLWTRHGTQRRERYDYVEREFNGRFFAVVTHGGKDQLDQFSAERDFSRKREKAA